MSEAIFARPRYEYGSYSDYHKLIRLSGYRLIYFDEIDPDSDNTYILVMLNGEIGKEGWPNAKARIILHDIEWRLDGEYPKYSGINEIWASDLWYAGKIGAKYVPFGSHPGLADSVHRNGEYSFDCTLMAYIYGRREAIYNGLCAAGVSVGPNGWGLEREIVLNRSRMMVHVHQFHIAATIAPQRFALAAAYKMPMISETVTDPGLLKNAVEYVPYTDIIPIVQARMNDPELQARGEALYHLLCEEYTFRKCIEAAL